MPLFTLTKGSWEGIFLYRIFLTVPHWGRFTECRAYRLIYWPPPNDPIPLVYQCSMILMKLTVGSLLHQELAGEFHIFVANVCRIWIPSLNYLFYIFSYMYWTLWVSADIIPMGWIWSLCQTCLKGFVSASPHQSYISREEHKVHRENGDASDRYECKNFAATLETTQEVCQKAMVIMTTPPRNEMWWTDQLLHFQEISIKKTIYTALRMVLLFSLITGSWESIFLDTIFLTTMHWCGFTGYWTYIYMYWPPLNGPMPLVNPIKCC